MSAREDARRQLGSASVMSEAEAVRALPCRDTVARKWLRERNLVHDTPLGKLVHWAEVVDALFGAPPAEEVAPRRGRLPRAGVYGR